MMRRRRLEVSRANHLVSSLDQTHSSTETASEGRQAAHLSRLILVDRDKSLEGHKYDEAAAPRHRYTRTHPHTRAQSSLQASSVSVTPVASPLEQCCFSVSLSFLRPSLSRLD